MWADALSVTTVPIHCISGLLTIDIVFMGLSVEKLRGFAAASMLYLAFRPRLYTSWSSVCEGFEVAPSEFSLLF